jgi:hypothetical protein
MNFEFPAMKDRDPWKQNRLKRGPIRLIFPEQRLPSKREVTAIARRKRGNAANKGNIETEPPSAAGGGITFPLFTI